MNSPRGLGLRTLLFGAFTVALAAFTIVRLITEGFVDRDSVAILICVLCLGMTLDLGYKWQKATRDRATQSTVDPADGEQTS
ncbi:hypothetical protein QCD70_12645 [Agreia sp. PsM10]|uniref:hypothetical protein n=1 Tax=Agreia sp. PsM10 TaxID=3030533 RepID=UPI00263BB266|nr:hypothetical protein [Agreia sp. PsM10]MDN4641099.1 hypothetical protein [Agreia sp. PsM10]